MEESGVKEGTCVVYTPHTTAAIVYNSGVNLVAIGLDVATHFDVNLTENDIAALDKSDKIPSLTVKFIKTPLKALFYLGFSAVSFLLLYSLFSESDMDDRLL